MNNKESFRNLLLLCLITLLNICRNFLWLIPSALRYIPCKRHAHRFFVPTIQSALTGLIGLQSALTVFSVLFVPALFALITLKRD